MADPIKISGRIVAVAAIALMIGGCTSRDGSPPPPPSLSPSLPDAQIAEHAVQADALKGAKAQHDINFGEVVIKAGCKGKSSPFDCRAFLFNVGLPDVPLTSDRYTATVGYGTADVKRRGGSNIQIFLNADSISDCTGAYLKSEDPRDLLACSP